MVVLLHGRRAFGAARGAWRAVVIGVSAGRLDRRVRLTPSGRNIGSYGLGSPPDDRVAGPIAACIAVFDWEGIQKRPGRRAALAAAIAFAESVTHASNNQVCPLTPLAEELGARRGTVTDLYLPRAVAERVPVVGVSALLVGAALHALAVRERRIR
jgi:hypothetical protein